MKVLMSRIRERNRMIESDRQNNGGPVDPGLGRRPVSRNTSKKTSRQAVSLVIWGRRKKSYTSHTVIKKIKKY